ncbi:MAG TPA: hypothetical protein VLE49_03720 [Anaerolineales bacterium]|nr:hypothetical protein [Anaerolineales bacterium]
MPVRVQPQKSFRDECMELRVSDDHFLPKINRPVDRAAFDRFWAGLYV